jgi:hypothetical protein
MLARRRRFFFTKCSGREIKLEPPRHQGTQLGLDNYFRNESAGFMKPKQLANVLIKILGLSMCAHGIPSIIDYLIYGTGGFSNGTRNSAVMLLQIIMGLVPIAIGIYLIVRSRWLVEKLFKDEGE